MMDERTLSVAAVVLSWIAGSAPAQDTTAYFRQNCVSCHTIGGGRLTGPDLKDVTKKKDREWLQSYLLNPQAKINAGDPYVLKMVEEARGVVMPMPPGITPELAGKLLDLIDAESALESSQFRGAQVSNAPFTPADVARGAAIFLGEQPLRNGGPACISCHSTAGLGGLSGGQLGPDLMRVYERLQGRMGLTAWLQSPGTVTMRTLFANTPLDPAEVSALVAYFEKQARDGAPATASAPLNFILYGLGGAILGLVLMDTFWRGRMRGVRWLLTHEQSSRGNS